MNDRTKPKIIHRAAKIAGDGRVSPLCAEKPRAINLKRATWTLQPDVVTCPKCRAKQIGYRGRTA